jgi:hypothetical protein
MIVKAQSDQTRKSEDQPHYNHDIHHPQYVSATVSTHTSLRLINLYLNLDYSSPSHYTSHNLQNSQQLPSGAYSSVVERPLRIHTVDLREVWISIIHSSILCFSFLIMQGMVCCWG